MKKNKFTLLLIVFIALLIPSMTSCKKKDELVAYKSLINEAINTTTAVTSKVEVKDQNEVVYEYVKSLIIREDNSGYVSIDEKTLDSSFSLSTKSTSETLTNVNRGELFKVELKKEYFNKYALDNNNFTGEISKDNMKNVFNSDYQIKDVAVLVITFENNKITKMECTYTSTTLKTVVMSTIYEY